MVARRGTSNRDARGSTYARKRRREWLVETYRADVDVVPDDQIPWWAKGDRERLFAQGMARGTGTPACRCYRCGKLLTVDTVTADRIKPGCQGGTYKRPNIRPCCSNCNSETGGATRRISKHRCVDCRREDPEGARRPRKIVEWSGPERCATHLRRAA